MSPKHLYVLLLALIAAGAVAGQSEDIPVENDNQFPPDDHLEAAEDVLEGSGKGITDEPDAFSEYDTTTIIAPPLEDVEATTDEGPTTIDPDQSCPTICVCNTEGTDFVVDCSGYSLTEFPSPLNPDTTILKVHNNQLTEIPKAISSLKNLKVLNAENNSIMELAPGSISELPELTVLKLANNRLLEIPLDLKNSYELKKLEELDLGGNDIRTELTPDMFSDFVSLRKLTLPTSKEELLQDFCAKMNTLEIICTGSCESQVFDCLDVPHTTEDDALDATVPGMIAFEESDTDPDLNTQDENTNPDNEEIPSPSDTVDTNLKTNIAENEDFPLPSETGDTNIITDNQDEEIAPLDETEKKMKSDTGDEFLIVAGNISPSNAIVSDDQPFNENPHSSRSGLSKVPEELNSPPPVQSDKIMETPKDTNKSESEVKVGATTTESNPGGINKSVIGFVVAGMVVIVAGITVGKNWSSIRRRFKSNSRTPERGGANANGTSPDEVPLKEKEKSPV